MNLQQAIAHYKKLKTEWGPTSNAYASYERVLLCLENARTEEEAVQSLQSDMLNARSAFRRKMYQEAIDHLKS